LTLRFDKRSGEDTSVFIWTIGGYILGLATTVFVMHVFKAAQPALLYIVPACILTAIVGAQMKGKFGLLWQYSEQETEEEEKEAAEGKAETKKDA